MNVAMTHRHRAVCALSRSSIDTRLLFETLEWKWNLLINLKETLVGRCARAHSFGRGDRLPSVRRHSEHIRPQPMRYTCTGRVSRSTQTNAKLYANHTLVWTTSYDLIVTGNRLFGNGHCALRSLRYNIFQVVSGRYGENSEFLWRYSERYMTRTHRHTSESSYFWDVLRILSCYCGNGNCN